MSNRDVLKDLIETLEDGREGFSQGAKKLADNGRAELSEMFDRFSRQRARFSSELRDVARRYGQEIDEDGSLAGALHRGWMSLKDAIAGDDPDGVLDASEQGEDHAKTEYEKALGEPSLDPEVRSVVERQYHEVKAAHDEVRAARDANES